jgi:diguanylate cyclase (GGDEF)-like protein
VNYHRDEIAKVIETTFRAEQARLGEEHSGDLRESRAKANSTHNAAAILPAEADSYIRHTRALTVARAEAIADAYGLFRESSGKAGQRDLEDYFNIVKQATRNAFESQARLMLVRRGQVGHLTQQLGGFLRKLETDCHPALLEGKKILARQDAEFRGQASVPSSGSSGALDTKSAPEAGDGRGEFDDLLPIYRRGLFDRDLEEFVKRAVKKQRPLALLMLDLDKFKAVNDEHGHPIGDEVLRDLANIVRTQIEGKGCVYRYGGEEVAILLPHFSAREGLAVAEELRIRVEHSDLSSKALKKTVSIGVACIPEHTNEAKALLEKADAALYQAKSLGRNLVRISGPGVPERPRTIHNDGYSEPKEFWEQRKRLGETDTLRRIWSRARWRIWIRPAEFKKARFRDLDQCWQFMTSSCVTIKGWFPFPWFPNEGVESGDEWIAREIERFEPDRLYLAERSVLFRSAQFVHNRTFQEIPQLGGRVHVLDILDVATATLEFASRMAERGVLSPEAVITFELYGLDGRQLTWPRDDFGNFDATVRDCWCQDERFAMAKQLTPAEIGSQKRELALGVALEIYSNFGWSEPPREPLKSAQIERFGAS